MGTVLLPVWFLGFLVLNALATFVKFGDAGCDDGSSGCMGAGPGARAAVVVLLGVVVLAVVVTWLLPCVRRLRVARWVLVAVSVLLGVVVLAVGVSRPSH
ncbi:MULTISPECIES: hypothetical protein [Kitasatospora]|uniref:hypothetical protein n=1 Tax=Kitasatospora TaxID=2063 RepID=UPI0011D198F0|nr:MULTISPECIES: hypothetical protein [Kitasatospora]